MVASTSPSRSAARSTCVVGALALGFVISVVYSFRTHHTRSFATTLALLPAIVCVVIAMVNGSVGAGVAVAGAFSLVRFRSVPGSGKDISFVFLAMLEDSRSNCRLIRFDDPILTEDEFDRIACLDRQGFRSARFSMTYRRDGGENALSDALAELDASVEKAVRAGANVVVISDRAQDGEVSIPSLLAVGSVHNHLIHAGIRMGFTGPERSVLDSLGVEVADVRGGARPVTADVSGHLARSSGETPVYVAGDARNGSTLVVTAISDGLACANEVAAALLK